MTTARQAATTLQTHCEKYCTGFYMSSVAYRGRALGARVRKGELQITPDFEQWVTIGPDAIYWSHSGRSIGNLAHWGNI